MPIKKSKPKLVVVCGPTGAGKTAFAVALAAVFKGEIINADSMQIYRHMNTGTAKPAPIEQDRIKHHLIDIIDPDEPFDASRFAHMASKLIFDLNERKQVPFVVGGTGLYIKALLHGLFKAKAADPAVRGRLKKEALDHGAQVLYERLQQCDSTAAQRIHPHDTFRIIRALEVYAVTGKTLSDYHQEHRFKEQPFQVLKVGLDMQREALYERINRRADDMITAGLLAEVKSLLEMGCSPQLKSMQSIGYRHMVAYLEGRLSWEEALRTFKRDTRRYAKRQLTWFKSDPQIHWIEPDRIDDAQVLIENFLHDSS